LGHTCCGPAIEHGQSIVIKGEVSGQKALFIDGMVEDSIHFPDHRITIGRRSRVKADIRAHDVVVMGSVKGNIQCSDLLDVRDESSIQGEIVTRRIRIDEGAVLKGSVEIQPASKTTKAPEPVRTEVAKPELPVVELPKSEPLPQPLDVASPAEPDKSESRKSPVAAAAAIVAKRVAGSSVLWKPGK
jgi:cytoskeletal protein CcmA (bactofilin family)